MPPAAAEALLTTALHGAHGALGARMVPFAGYHMPVQYEGVLTEHLWTRDHAGLFDVSHMGAGLLILDRPSGDGEADHATVAALVETLVPSDLIGLRRGQLRYTMLLNSEGGVIDDLMVGRPLDDDDQGRLFIVVNAGTKDADFHLIAQAAAGRATLRRLDDWSLLALQGPQAAAVLDDILPGAADGGFMTWRRKELDGVGLIVARAGYTGEDGFELTVPNAIAADLWDRLIAAPRVRPVGLGARDSLRLEAGLPLYGHDLDHTVSPVEAGMAFVVAGRRRAASDFPGAGRILKELTDGPARVRAGLRIAGAPAREGAQIVDADGAQVGQVTSGAPSPSLGAPIAIGFVPPPLAAVGTRLQVMVRGRAQPAEIVPLPFVPHRYVRKP